MSHTTSAMLSRAQSAVAVAGATGNLGWIVSEAFLTTFKPFFSRILILSRNLSSSRAQALSALGAELVHVRLDEVNPENAKSLQDVFAGIDILVNVLGRSDACVHDMLAEAAIQAGVKVYFPSEFGIDHRLNDFPGFDHKEWGKKRKHFSSVSELAAKNGGDVKIIAVYPGLFLEDALSPRFGFDIDNHAITTIGPSTVRTTFTSKVDIARAVAQLAILAMLSPAALSDSVPAHVRISGKFRITEEDLAGAKETLSVESARGLVGAPAGHIRVLMGEGKLDFSEDNENELVNPNERLWKWKTIEETIKKEMGK
ncbi:hypothetical protein EW145_g7451 [Phellinidium pouzarii]|uniref:NmrA-like domain-containing protein n=1 Tax=Phellinidium pouzarii TaxID=167371 RepID=A0A4S4KKR4_9AGAM|nr:hypothetical protein EW145_g7451 [Phellinidium pouzarii]